MKKQDENKKGGCCAPKKKEVTEKGKSELKKESIKPPCCQKGDIQKKSNT